MTNPPSKVECDAALHELEVDAHVSWDKLRANNNADQVRARIAHLEQEVEKLQKAINEGYAYKYMTDDSPTLFTLIREATDEG